GETPNMDWHPYSLRLGDTLFLHGDVANRKMNHCMLEESRKAWVRERQRGKALNRLHDVAFQFNVHKSVSQLAHPTKRVVARVMAYLETTEPALRECVRHGYLGHHHFAYSHVTSSVLRYPTGHY